MSSDYFSPVHCLARCNEQKQRTSDPDNDPTKWPNHIATVDFIFPNSFKDPSEEDQEKMKSSGVEEYDILMGLDAFYGLLDGLIVNYRDHKFTLIKTLDNNDEVPNFMRASGKPAIRFQINNEEKKAFIDTGSPRHVFSKNNIQNAEIFQTKVINFGNYEYQLSTLYIDQLLNLSDIKLEAADYGYSVDKKFNVDHWFGSFLRKKLFFDLKNRIVSIEE